MRDPLVEPCRRHRAAQLLEHRAVGPAALHEGEDHLRVDRHPRLGMLEAVRGEQLLVVVDHTVVDPDDRAVPDRVVVGEEGRMALREIADVNECLDDIVWELDGVEELRRARSLLVEGHRRRAAAVGVTGGVSASLGDTCEKCLRRERPIDARVGREAVSRDSAHQRIRSLESDIVW